MTDFLLGIDLGSTSIKTILYDLQGNAVAKGTRPMRRFHPNPDHPEWVVWDPDELWNETAAAIRDVVGRIADPSDIKGMATTGMGMDGLPMTEDGRALYPLISWHDPRTQPQYDRWVKEIGADKTFSIGGNPVWAINSALRMLWIKEHEPDIFAKTFKWLLIEDYVNFRLCGAFASDYSMASCTMLFDQRTQDWSDEMSRLSGIPLNILPDVFSSTTAIGPITASAAVQTGLKEGTPVFLGGHDHICSSIPVGAFRSGKVLCITGTWEMIDMFAAEPPLDPLLGRSGLTTQSHVVPKGYSLWGGNPAGEMLEWCRRNFASPSNNPDSPLDWEYLIRMVGETAPGSGGVLFLPHLGGSSCPNVDPRSRGAFVGLNVRTTQAEMIRSIFEGINYQLLDVITTMERGTGRKSSEIIAVGGSTQNGLWMQSKADMLGLPVTVPGVEEATVLGAAILAGIGAGLYRDAEDAFERIDCRNVRYVPDETHAMLYQAVFETYRELYHAVKPIHHKIFDRFALSD